MMAKTMARMSQAVFLSFTSIKQLCTMGWISAGRCPIAGYVPSTATLNIIVCADKPGRPEWSLTECLRNHSAEGIYVAARTNALTLQLLGGLGNHTENTTLS